MGEAAGLVNFVIYCVVLFIVYLVVCVWLIPAFVSSRISKQLAMAVAAILVLLALYRLLVWLAVVDPFPLLHPF